MTDEPSRVTGEPSAASEASDDNGPTGTSDHHPSSSVKPVYRQRDRYGDGEVLPSVTRDEQEIGWGDEPSGYSDEWYRSQRPPHHGG